MRVCVAAYGTRGDVEPVVALAVCLRELGAEVRLCAPPDEEFVPLLDRAGVPLVPFARAWRSWEQGPSTAAERVLDVDEFVAGHIAATYDPLLAAADGADVLLATGMLHFVAGSVAEKLAIAHRFAVFAPVLDMPERDARIGPPVNAHRESIGLPPVRDVREFLFTARPWVAADPVLGRWPAPAGMDVARTPAWILPDERPLPAELTTFLDTGSPPVYVGFGSMRVPQDSARIAVDAIRGQGHRVVLAAGWAGLTDDRDGCLVIGEVNQQALFRRVAAVVHHGGAGTTATATRAGVPQVVLAQAADQSYWAGRVAELGIGVAHEGPVPTVESLSAALRLALAPRVGARAAEVAATIRTDGTTVAAELLREAANPADRATADRS